MYHHAARSLDRRLVFTSWTEGLRLFHTLVRATPGLVALCVMPDHVHVLAREDARARLGVALGGYARWHNARHGTSGAVWRPLPAPSYVNGRKKERRNRRYIHLNPCRAGLVDDPLAWPLSTHLDAVGLALEPVMARATRPVEFHRYVSGDPHVQTDGTELPWRVPAAPAPAEVLDATSFLLRVPIESLRIRGPRRQLAIRAMRTLTSASQAKIAALTGASRRTVGRVRPGSSKAVRTIERCVGDPRCAPLHDSVLGMHVRSSRYRHGWASRVECPPRWGKSG